MPKGSYPQPRVIWYMDTIKPKVLAAPVKINEAIDHVLEFQANEAQNDMRTGAPWTDQTGNARQGLFARAGSGSGGRDAGGRFTKGGKFIVLYHTMPYGVWLELKHSGQYAIIMPTIRTRGPKVMRQLSEVLAAVT